MNSDEIEENRELVIRLQGLYPIGPYLPNGEPEFGWRKFDVSPIQQEAAIALTSALDEIERLRKGLEECEDEIDTYIMLEYPLDHPVHDRYRERDFSANPARLTLGEKKDD